MKIVEFKPVPETDGKVVGWLHEPIWEMPVRRETFPAVVICPGGAYAFVSEREAEPVAQAFFAAGYNTFILTYSVGEKAKGFAPLIEVGETLRIIRETPEYRVDPEKTAVCGFSAGGHLAASAGVLWGDEKFLKVYGDKGGANRPNAMVLGYPVITADEFAHVESIENVSGAKCGSEEYKWFSLDKRVSEKTCPAFIWHTADDDCVPVENSLRFAAALSSCKVPFELHVYPSGIHGLSVCTNETGYPSAHNAAWAPAAIAWLNMTLGFEG